MLAHASLWEHMRALASPRQLMRAIRNNQCSLIVSGAIKDSSSLAILIGMATLRELNKNCENDQKICMNSPPRVRKRNSKVRNLLFAQISRNLNVNFCTLSHSAPMCRCAHLWNVQLAGRNPWTKQIISIPLFGKKLDFVASGDNFRHM